MGVEKAPEAITSKRTIKIIVESAKVSLLKSASFHE